MQDLQGKTAFITGGASGMGYAMAEAFGREGMNVMIADIEREALARAVASLREKQVHCEGVVADVASRASMRGAALETVAKFGKVHVLVNNAGVGVSGPMEKLTDGDWRWVMAVNLKGVVNGVEIFTPLIESHGEGGHIISTASLAGMFTNAGMEPYSATKFAVVALSEGWRAQLKNKRIGVSVLCPALVNTNILESYRNRPDAYGGAVETKAARRASVRKMMDEGGMPAHVVAAAVLEAIKDDVLYIIPHPEYRAVVEPRLARIEDAFSKASQSVVLNGKLTSAPGQNYRGKVVFITGGASGIGLGMARAFGHAGASVMIADIQEDAIAKALEALRAAQVRVEGVKCDVTDRASVRAAALKTIGKFGRVDVVCNNAGVCVNGRIGELSENEWDWQNDVNIMGVAHGVEVFAPLMAAQPEGGRIVNTASGAGMVVGPGGEPYAATKYAVLAMSEGWREQLAPKNVKVSVLCPGMVNTRILESRRNRGAAYGGPGEEGEDTARTRAELAQGLDPNVAGARVVEALGHDEFYILTHTEFRDIVANRHKRIRAAFDRWEKSPALSVLPKRPPPRASGFGEQELRTGRRE